MKTIRYEDWIKKAVETRKISSKILSHFDLSKLKRRPRDPEEEVWLRERGLQSRFEVSKG